MACTESRCLPDVIEIDLLMLDPEAVPTFTRSRKVVSPEIVVLLTALAVTVTGEVSPVASSVGVEMVTIRVPDEVYVAPLAFGDILFRKPAFPTA